MVAYLLKTEGSEDTGEVQITATIDGKVKLVSEAFIRRHLKLQDSDGISTLPNTKIFEQLALIGIPIRQETKVPRPSSPTHTYIADKAASTGVDVRHGWATTTISSLDVGQGSGNIDKTPSIPHDSPLLRVNTLRSDEGSMTLNELTVLCIKLSQKVETLKADWKQTKKVYGAAYTKLIMKVSTQREAQSQESQLEDQLGVFSAAKVLVEVAKLHTYTRRRRTISTASGGISTAAESVSTAGASMPVSTAGMVDKDIQAKTEADEELALRIQAEEMEKYSKAKNARLLVRYPIIDWNLYIEDSRKHWKFIRVGNHIETYQFFADMLKKFDRDDLVQLWSLVKERFSTIEPTYDKEKELWVELKRLFEPDVDDTL
nr:hypothetical protein [Tanacetum cinerariifolium]